MSYIAVAGGVHVDIGARSLQKLRTRDANPGRVHISFGGVGRNIAHNLRLLGTEVELLSALGGDGNAEALAASCRELGIGISHALRLPELNTSACVSISDEKGDVSLAVWDMEICGRVTPEYLAGELDTLNAAALVVADANLPEDSLRFLAERLTVPLFVDPVSTAKAEKLLGILPAIHTLKPNSVEAELLSGVSVVDRQSARRAARRLIDLGVGRVFVSLGKQGFIAAAEDETVWQPSLPPRLRNTTGAGDAMMAALAWAWLRGENLSRSAAFAAAASSISVESREAVNPALSPELLRERAGL